MTHPWRWGAAALGAYLTAVVLTAVTGLVVVRPLYDGLAPPAPYNWVDPPDEFAEDNVQPRDVADSVPFDPEGSRSQLVSTPDGQLRLILSMGGFEPREGATGVRVSITALDPEPLPEVEGELRVDGNAYRIEAVYEPSGDPASLAREATLVLRYPRHATAIGRTEGRAWELLDTEPAPVNLDLFADTPELGTFAAIGPPPEGEGGPPPWVYALAGVVAAAAVFEAFRFWQRRQTKEATGRAARRRDMRARDGKISKGRRRPKKRR